MRRSAVSFLVALGLLICAGVALKLIVTPEEVHSRIESQLQRTFNRRVDIERVTIVLHQGVKVSGLKVYESEAFPGNIFLSSEYLILKYKLASLLRGRVELDEVRLMAPSINLVRRRDGISNLQDMFGTEHGEKKEKSGIPPLYAADKITIEQGRLSVRDYQRWVNLKVSDFNLLARNFSPEKPFPIQISFSNQTKFAGKTVRNKLDLVGEIMLAKFDAKAAYLVAKKLKVDIDGERIELKGRVKNFHSPEFDLNMSLPAFDSVKLSKYVKMPEGIRVPASKIAMKLKLPYSTSVSSAVAVSTFTETETDAETFAGVITPERYILEKLELDAPPVKLALSGVIEAKGGKWANLKAVLAKVDAEKASGFWDVWRTKNFGGTAEGTLELRGPLKKLKPKSLALVFKDFSMEYKPGKKISHADITLRGTKGLENLHARVSKGRYVAYGNAFSDFDMDFTVAGEDMVFKKFATTWNESRLSLVGCVKNFRKKDEQKFFFDGTVDKFKVADTYSAIENYIILRKKEKDEPIEYGKPWATTFRFGIPATFPDLEGRLMFNEAISPNFQTQNFKLEMALGKISRGLDDVSGIFKIGFGPGRIRQVPLVRKANGLLNVLIFPFSYMHEIYQKARLSMDNVVLNTLDITRTYGDFAVKKGKVDVRYIHFDSPQFAAYANGTADFSTEKVNLDVIMRSMAAGARLPDRLVDTQGRPSIRLKVKDNLNEPTAEINLNKVTSDALENALSEGLKRGTMLDPIDGKLTCGRKL